MSNGTKNGQIPVWRLAQELARDGGKVTYEEHEGSVPMIPVMRLVSHDQEVSEVMTEIAEDSWPLIARQFVLSEG